MVLAHETEEMNALRVTHLGILLEIAKGESFTAIWGVHEHQPIFSRKKKNFSKGKKKITLKGKWTNEKEDVKEWWSLTWEEMHQTEFSRGYRGGDDSVNGGLLVFAFY